MREVWPVTSDRCGNRLARFRVRANFARERQQSLGDLGRNIINRNVLRDRGPLVSAFDIGPEPSGLERDAVAEILRTFALGLVAALPELLRVAAVGIV